MPILESLTTDEVNLHLFESGYLITLSGQVQARAPVLITFKLRISPVENVIKHIKKFA